MDKSFLYYRHLKQIIWEDSLQLVFLQTKFVEVSDGSDGKSKSISHVYTRI